MISKIEKIYDKIIDRLPSTYHRPKLVIHKSWVSLYKEWHRGNDSKIVAPWAFYDLEKDEIHICRFLINSNMNDILFCLLHEIRHSYRNFRVKRWIVEIEEKNANDFAGRWVKKLNKENF
jgi:hypothetical protein